ncbi:hypothetical protein AVEN_161342-1 [Araneus ventricosus]|uniref:Uncharacterized protein n=1 Tax=Araneus ventricosus TaxID=182803 RepID=A0A4Y2TLB9_ARAVE|nr:hypothetical protein AVEN_161342-1 [Araneus ventricosus]
MLLSSVEKIFVICFQYQMNSDRSSTIQFYLCHTALSRFVSGHLRSCSFSHGNKVFPVCAKCGVASASPEHILSCLRLSRETFETDPLLALDFLRVSGLMDGV